MKRGAFFLCMGAAWLAATPLLAQDEDAATARAREAFARGVQLSKDEQWGDALSQFEEAEAARDAPLVRFNIAYCQRALAHYVAARKTLATVLADSTGLDPARLEDAKSYAAEFERVIARADVTLDPAGAAITIDGRPLVEDAAAPDTFLAGVAPAGEAKPMGKSRFTVLLDPGVHVIVAAREGHQDAFVRASYHAGEKAKLDLHLDVLAASVRVDTDPRQALVKLDGHEVGIAPIDVQRAAGRYKLEIELNGYQTYATALTLAPGQRVELTPKLLVYHPPITKRWWFWAGAAAIVVGGVLAAYFVVRANEPPPPYDGGNTNWIAHGQGFSF